MSFADIWDSDSESSKDTPKRSGSREKFNSKETPKKKQSGQDLRKLIQGKMSSKKSVKGKSNLREKISLMKSDCK
jgi:hypothetical protein